jgi:GcrA cell cycle regulator
MRNTGWTESRLGLLKQLWAAGETAAAIAARLGVTPSAVLGKVHRLQLGPRPKAKRTRKAPVAKSPEPRRRGERDAEAEPVAEVTKRGVSLFELTNGTCRWPIGEPGTAGFHFCGAAGADLENDQPYCERHARRAFVRGGKSAGRISRSPGSDGGAAVASPPLAPTVRWQRIILDLLGRRS